MKCFAQIPWPGLKKWRDFKYFLPKNIMFPLITWKEQAICLQKLQAVVITLSLLNFLEEYLIEKRTLYNDINFLALYWKCACVDPIFSRCEQKLSQCTGKQNSVIKSEENSDCYYLSNRKMIEVVCSSRVRLLAFYFRESFTAHKWFFD